MMQRRQTDAALTEPVGYMRRTRDWYLGLGYERPYEWAHHPDAPFTPLTVPLALSTVTLITTAVPYDAAKGPQGQGAPYNSAAKFYEVYSLPTATDPDLRIAHVGIDRKNADMTDQGAWFPLVALRQAAPRIGRIAPRFHGAPTNRSQRHTMEVDAPEILARCREDGVTAAILVPNCPVCHQTVTLVARHLEENGIATVIMGAAKDIVEHAGAPRLLFSDMPLGNAAGRPNDPESQLRNLHRALDMLEHAPGPRTTMHSPETFSPDPGWKLDYSNIHSRTQDEVAVLRAEAERARLTARRVRAETLGAP
ncbi:glycine reductase [Haematobacter missouriensis]|uniref:Glycine reductase n=1 Tax=Haematobacter missouriensis TaxID=366616 RepID=A0A212AL67_9RHOB|nr:glycine reductase [Haematobacter missouriensis]KFI32462.1 glycine reductase [Haematobacter missouriensis]OWJ76468.1 glycine reductase [Haematobacter missouriensis]OWJ82260.1 glycine reductase [Haematobacter missouriensis]